MCCFSDVVAHSGAPSRLLYGVALALHVGEVVRLAFKEAYEHGRERRAHALYGSVVRRDAVGPYTKEVARVAARFTLHLIEPSSGYMVVR